MNFDEFKDFIDKQDTLLRNVNTSCTTEKEYMLVRTIKISEEFGELCDEILASIGAHRKSKMDGRSMASLSDEFADVIITTFLLAKTMGVDIPVALNTKIKKIREKHNKELRS